MAQWSSACEVAAHPSSFSKGMRKAHALQRTPMLATFCACAQPAPSIGGAELQSEIAASLDMIERHLKERLEFYERVLTKHGIALPYVRHERRARSLHTTPAGRFSSAFAVHRFWET